MLCEWHIRCPIMAADHIDHSTRSTLEHIWCIIGALFAFLGTPIRALHSFPTPTQLSSPSVLFRLVLVERLHPSRAG